MELLLDDIKKLLPSSFVKKLKLVSLCGVYGEPIWAKDLKKIIQYLYECNGDIDMYLLYVASTRSLHEFIILYNNNLVSVYKETFDNDSYK